MRLGVRRKLFLLSSGFILVGVLITGFILESLLRVRTYERIENDLVLRVATAKVALNQATLDKRFSLVASLGREADARVTLIDANGIVLADSEVQPDQLATLTNHADRPEVIAAKEHGQGIARRYSETLETEMVYVAQTIDDSILRVAVPLREVEQAVSSLRATLLGAVLVGLLFSVLLSFFATDIIAKSLRESREVEKIRRGFVASVSHELRTPVSVIRANAETLLDGALDDQERAESFVEGILRNSERLTSLITDLLDIARIESGQYPFEMGPTNVAAVVQRAVDAIEKASRDKQVALHADIQDPTVAWADASALEHVLLNLLENAVRYVPEGGNVTLDCTEEGGHLLLRVADDGPGIPEKHHARLFERFYRVDKGRSRAKGGTGLGLSIVKHLIDGMQGTTGYAVNDPHGSIFWVRLRIEK